MRTFARCLLPLFVAVLVPVTALPARAGNPANPPAAPAPGEPIPPAFRFERHLAAGKAYLESLPEGTRITVHRNDGTRFTLLLRGGILVLDPDLPPTRKDGDTVITPLGHRLRIERISPGKFRLEVTAPGGARTQVTRFPSRLLAVTSDGQSWTYPTGHELALRLTDGTELVTSDRARKWVVTDLHGARFRWEETDPRWIELPALPAPPLVPRILGYWYQAGDGNDWRRPVREDHLVFAWNWYPVGLPLARLLSDVQQEPRLHDIRYQYERTPRMQTPPEEAAVIVGRRFALCGGDRVTFALPGQQPVTSFIFPGPIDPDYTLPRRQLPGALPLPGTRPAPSGSIR